jgi:hypothetical protein
MTSSILHTLVSNFVAIQARHFDSSQEAMVLAYTNAEVYRWADHGELNIPRGYSSQFGVDVGGRFPLTTPLPRDPFQIYPEYVRQIIQLNLKLFI